MSPSKKHFYCQQEFLVKVQVEPGSNEAKKMCAGSGQRLLPLLNTSTPVGACLKTLLGSTTWGSTEYLLTWRASVTKRGSLRFRLVPSTPRRSGRGFGSWLTPRETMIMETPEKFRARKNSKRANDRKNGMPNLAVQVKAIWPTPQSYDGKRGGPQSPEKCKEGNHGQKLQDYIGQSSYGPLALTESFVVRLTTLSAWLMGYTGAYLRHWETRLSRR